MKHTTLLATLALCLTTLGCAHQEKMTYSAPSVVAVRTSVEKLKPLVRPEGQKAISNLESAITAYEVQVDQQAQDLAKAQNDAVFFKEKHSKALRQLWFWRGLAAITLASLAGWFALRLGYKFAL